MEPNIVRVGRTFINLSTLLWAEVRSGSEPNKQIIDLIYAQGNQRLACHLTGPEADQVIHHLESQSLDLRFIPS
jgi:hypothetical protein